MPWHLAREGGNAGAVTQPPKEGRKRGPLRRSRVAVGEVVRHHQHRRPRPGQPVRRRCPPFGTIKLGEGVRHLHPLPLPAREGGVGTPGRMRAPGCAIVPGSRAGAPCQGKRRVSLPPHRRRRPACARRWRPPHRVGSSPARRGRRGRGSACPCRLRQAVEPVAEGWKRPGTCLCPTNKGREPFPRAQPRGNVAGGSSRGGSPPPAPRRTAPRCTGCTGHGSGSDMAGGQSGRAVPPAAPGSVIDNQYQYRHALPRRRRCFPGR